MRWRVLRRCDILKTDHLNPNQTKKLVSSYLWYNGYGSFALYTLKVLIEKTFLDGRKAIPSLTLEELEKYNKFRHKILHGDKNYLKYGTIKNYIQSWLELDLLFLIYLAVVNINKKD